MKPFKVFFLCLSFALEFACSNGTTSHTNESAETPTQKDSTTRVVIDNIEEETVFFQWFSLFNPGSIPAYESRKQKDTVIIDSPVPITINVLSPGFSNNSIYTIHTYWLNTGEQLVLSKRKGVLPLLKDENNPHRNNELRFPLEYQKVFGNFMGFGVEPPFKTLPAVQRIHKIIENYNERLLFLNNFAKEYSISNEFINRVSDEFYYTQFTDFLWLYEDQEKRELLKNKEVQNFIESFKINNKTKALDTYAHSLKEVSKFYLLQNNQPADLSSLYFFAREKYADQTRDILLYKIIYDSISENEKEVSKLTDDFLTICQSNSIRTEVSENFLEYNRIQEHQAALSGNDAILINYNTDQKITWTEFLKNNKGKIIYLDFWASWCGPCIREIPFSLQLMSELRDENIAFVLVSQDNLKTNWKRSVKKHKLEELPHNYLLGGGDKSPILKHFNIYEIPRYVILNKDGKIINSNAPRPSDKNIKEILIDLVNE